MKKYYIFSEMWGSYSYTVIIVEANSIIEAVQKCESLQNVKIRDFNYNPFVDPNTSITIDFHKMSLFTKEELDLIDQWKNPQKLIWIINNYKKVFDNSHYGSRLGISKKEFLRTETEGWFDWIEVYGDLPENYEYMDGHDG